MLKVTGGKHRGRKIESLPGKEVRPTTGFLREAVFNILMHGRFGGENSPLIGQRVVDVFCGTGAMGFEALSRGALHVTLIDQNPKAIAAARMTAERFKEEQNVALVRSDSASVPKAPRPCMLAFIDPPYGTGLAGKALASLISGGWLAKNAVVVVEQAKQEKPFTVPEECELLDERVYNITRIYLLRFKGTD